MASSVRRRGATSDEMSVEVSSTRTHHHGMTSFTLYAIKVTAGRKTWFVYRRYSEMYRFYHGLCALYPELRIEFPPRVARPMQKPVIEARRQNFEVLLNTLLLSPDVELLGATKRFLSQFSQPAAFQLNDLVLHRQAWVYVQTAPSIGLWSKRFVVLAEHHHLYVYEGENDHCPQLVAQFQPQDIVAPHSRSTVRVSVLPPRIGYAVTVTMVGGGRNLTLSLACETEAKCDAWFRAIQAQIESSQHRDDDETRSIISANSKRTRSRAARLRGHSTSSIGRRAFNSIGRAAGTSAKSLLGGMTASARTASSEGDHRRQSVASDELSRDEMMQLLAEKDAVIEELTSEMGEMEARSKRAFDKLQDQTTEMRKLKETMALRRKTMDRVNLELLAARNTIDRFERVKLQAHSLRQELAKLKTIHAAAHERLDMLEELLAKHDIPTPPAAFLLGLCPQPARVMREVVGNDFTELDLEMGEVITVTEINQSQWWRGRKQDGTTGIFPSYAVVLTRQPTDLGVSARSTEPFKDPSSMPSSPATRPRRSPSTRSVEGRQRSRGMTDDVMSEPASEYVASAPRSRRNSISERRRAHEAVPLGAKPRQQAQLAKARGQPQAAPYRSSMLMRHGSDAAAPVQHVQAGPAATEPPTDEVLEHGSVAAAAAARLRASVDSEASDGTNPPSPSRPASFTSTESAG